MSDQSSLLFLRAAPATGNTQWEVDTSATYTFTEFEGQPSWKAGPRKLERNLMRADAEHYSRVVGPDEPPTLSYQCLLRGMKSNAGGAMTVAANQDELGPVFDATLGAAGSVYSNTGTTITSVSGTTVNLGSSTGFNIGEVIGVSTTTGFELREIVTVPGGTSVTIDRAYATDPAASATVYGGISWYPDNDNPNHTPIHYELEGVNWRREMYGCLGGWTIDFPAGGGLATVNFDMKGTVWSDIAETNPSFTAPDVGDAIPSIGGRFWIGSTAYMVRDLKITYEPTLVPRTTYSGVNGFLGYAVTDKKIRMEGTLLFGATFTSGVGQEATDTIVGNMQSATTYDVLFEIGSAAGAAFACRMPAADFDGDIVSVDGMDAIKFVAHGTRSGNHTLVPGAARIHLV